MSNPITPGAASQILEFTPGGTESTFLTAPSLSFLFGGLAFDSAGNLFVSTEGNLGSDTILKFTSEGVESTFASGLNDPRGLAFNTAGNLLVAEFLTPTMGDILEFTPSGAETVFASGVSGPTWLAVEPRTVPDASSTWTLLLLGLTAMSGVKPLLRGRVGSLT